MKNFLLYGSYGFTGQLIVDRALREGLRPLLAGRNEKKLRAQAEYRGLHYRVFSLGETAKLDSALGEVDAVLHCAGPFVHTFRQMAEACLRTKRHYVDISGEIPGFEALAALDQQAKEAGIMLLPGAGFDVVPSDCLAAYVKQRLPNATHFRLFVRVGAGFSRGTAKSAVENMHRQGMIRRNGTLVQVPPVWNVREQDFGQGYTKVVSIGWGDVSTAYFSTGIPNIETYFAFPEIAISSMRSMRILGPLVYNRFAKSILKALIQAFLPPGPPEEKRKRGRAVLIGEATSQNGGRAVSKIITPEGYTCTALTTVEIMKRILNGECKAGFQTPSLAYGKDFIMQFQGIQRQDIV